MSATTEAILLDDWPDCEATRGNLFCQRDLGHNGPHLCLIGKRGTLWNEEVRVECRRDTRKEAADQ